MASIASMVARFNRFKTMLMRENRSWISDSNWRCGFPSSSAPASPSASWARNGLPGGRPRPRRQPARRHFWAGTSPDCSPASSFLCPPYFRRDHHHAAARRRRRAGRPAARLAPFRRRSGDFPRTSTSISIASSGRARTTAALYSISPSFAAILLAEFLRQAPSVCYRNPGRNSLLSASAAAQAGSGHPVRRFTSPH